MRMTAPLGFDRGSRRRAVNMDLPKTTSPKMKTAKEMNNVQSQTKIKLHQLIRKIFARYLYSSLDPLQQRKHPRSRSRQTKTKTYSFKIWRNRMTIKLLIRRRQSLIRLSLGAGMKDADLGLLHGCLLCSSEDAETWIAHIWPLILGRLVCPERTWKLYT